MLLEGKVALVSGIGPGMGRDIAKALAAEGADIVMGARRTKGLEKVSAEVAELGRRAVAVPCDITSVEDCERIVAAARDELGRLDILVNNAFAMGDLSTLESTDFSGWRTAMEVNFFGTLQLTRAAVPLLAEQDDSRIVMINTMSVHNIEVGYGSYAASKAALETATKTLAKELGPKGIRVNGVHPGYIWGKSVEWYFNHQAEERGTTFQEVYDGVAAETCLGYLAPSAEIAGTVVYLASPLARPVTGQSIRVDCGQWLF
jgi:NAD(P)-dependent dehydrogenase (short-subunit alcohol dehydrogenase family)